MQDIVRVERKIEGNKAIQTTTRSDGSAEATGAIIIIGLVVTAIAFPFLPLFWGMFQIIRLGQTFGWPPLLAVAVAGISAILCLFLLFRSKRFRYVYFFMYACGLVVFVNAAATAKWDATWGGVDAAVVWLIGLAVGFVLSNFRETIEYVRENW